MIKDGDSLLGKQSLGHLDKDHVPTPEWLIPFFDNRPWFDPYLLRSSSPMEPYPLPSHPKLWVNAGFSNIDEVVENAIRWHQEGRFVAIYMPFESSTKRGKRLIQYGIKKLYFDGRPYPKCRNIEIVILTGETT